MKPSGIEAALTPEEWEEALSWHHGVKDYLVRPAESIGYGDNAPEDLHRVAALCLHGQPFGFAWEDVEALRFIVEWGEANPGTCGRFASLADRIASLLLPREPESLPAAPDT